MFFLPLFDENPSHRPPIITWLFMAVCILVFIYQSGLGARDATLFVMSYGAIPALVTGDAIRPLAYAPIANEATLITSMFMHGGWLHLGGNMLYLWIFGDNIEDSFGHLKFILFYILCGVAATLTHIAIAPTSGVPLVGASGAIAGVLAAYLLLYPHARIRVIMLIFIFIRWVSFPAMAVLAAWLIIQFLSAPASLINSGGGGVAYFAHIGGFAAGLILTPLFKRKGQPFFAGANQAGAAASEYESDFDPEYEHDYRLGLRGRPTRSNFLNRYRSQPRRRPTSLPSNKRDNNESGGPWE